MSPNEMLRVARSQAGMTLGDVAAEVAVSVSHVSDLEHADARYAGHVLISRRRSEKPARVVSAVCVSMCLI